MKKTIILFLLSLLTAFSQQPLKLDLEKSMSLALKHNHDLKLAYYDKEIADERVDEAWGSSVFPTIRGNVDYSRAIKRGVITIETPFFAGSFPAGTENTLTIGASLEQPLFTGAVFLAVKVAKTYAEIADKLYSATRSEVKVNVTRAYYTYLLSKEVADLSKMNLKLAEDNLRNTEIMYKAGVVPEYDFIRSKVQMQNLIPEVHQAENNLAASENLLKIVTGLELSQPIVVEDSLYYRQKENIEYENAKEILFADNDVIKQLQLQIELNESAASYQFTKHFPELYFTGNWQAQAQENDPRPFNKWRYNNSVYVGLNLKVPIFDGLQTTSKVQQAEIEVLKAKEQYQKLSKQINSQLEQTVLGIEQKEEQIKSLGETIDEAEFGYDIASKRYANGVGTQLEVVDAMVSLSRAKVNYYNAIHDYYILHSQLSQLLSDSPYNNFKN